MAGAPPTGKTIRGQLDPPLHLAVGKRPGKTCEMRKARILFKKRLTMWDWFGMKHGSPEANVKRLKCDLEGVLNGD